MYVCFLRGENVCTCVGWAWKRRVCGDAYEGGGGRILGCDDFEFHLVLVEVFSVLVYVCVCVFSVFMHV